MVYSAVSERESGRSSRRQPAAGLVSTRAIVTLDDRRYVLDGPKATIGRSKDAECVLRDPNVSRRHAELRRAETGDWQIVDLGSTNGIKVNGRRVSSSRLRPGDEVTIGTTTFRSTSSNESVDYEPISVALKFGFLAVLYLFLLWIARSALEGPAPNVAPAPDATGFHAVPAAAESGAAERGRLAGRRARRRPATRRALRPLRRPLDRPRRRCRRPHRGPLRLRPARQDLLQRAAATTSRT